MLYIHMCEKFCSNMLKIMYQQWDVFQNIVENAFPKDAYEWCEKRFVGKKYGNVYEQEGVTNNL